MSMAEQVPGSGHMDESAFHFRRLIGYRMTGFAQDWAQFELVLEEKHMNGDEIPHGGVYATLLDTVLGFSGAYTGDPDRRRMAMTLSLTTNFVAPPQGKVMIAEARKAGGGRSTFYANGQITDDTGRLLATGSGVFRYRRGE